MKVHWWINLVLLILVASLSTWAYFKSKPPEIQQYPLSILNPGTIKEIHVENFEDPPLTLQKINDQWRMSSPLSARADPIRIQTLMSLISLKSRQRLASTEISRFELDRPKLKIRFDQQVFTFGMLNPLTMEQYIGTSDTIFLVNLPFSLDTFTKPYNLTSKQLLGETEKPISFEFAKFSLSQTEGRWAIQPMTKLQETSQDLFNQWIDRWRFISAQLTGPEKPGAKLGEIKVKLENGKTVVFTIKQKDPTIILLRNDEQIEYSFPKEIGESLLSSPLAGLM